MSGLTTLRGYGTRHQKIRAEVAKIVRAGEAVCWRCGRPIHPFEAWDLGHDDHDRSLYRGPECLRCNRGASSRRRRKIRRLSRVW